MFSRRVLERVVCIADRANTRHRDLLVESLSRYFCNRLTIRTIAAFNALLLGIFMITLSWKYLQLERLVLTNKDGTLENFWPQPDAAMFQLLESFANTSLDRDIKILSSDEMEGRGVGTEGERKSARFIANSLGDAFLQGAFAESSKDTENVSFYQQVPLEGVEVENHTFVSILKDLHNHSLELIQGESCFLTTDRNDTDLIKLSWSKLLFGGYCIYAPEEPFLWDDFGNTSVQGKLVLCLVNQPSSFVEERLTYYGRWTYKLEELRRRGALGVLLLHTEESAGYGWNVIRSNAKTERIR